MQNRPEVAESPSEALLRPGKPIHPQQIRLFAAFAFDRCSVMLKPALESSLNRHSFERELRLALDAAQANYSRGLREFQQIISEVPSGLTSPDGKFRVESRLGVLYGV